MHTTLVLLLLITTTAFTQLTSSGLTPRLDELCRLPANDYYCCKFKDPSVDFDLRCEFLLKVLDEPDLCQYL